jgi:hypothetical protein
LLEKKVPKEIFGSGKGKVIEQFRMSPKDELELWRSQGIDGTVKCMRMRWAGHAARMCVNAVR